MHCACLNICASFTSSRPLQEGLSHPAQHQGAERESTLPPASGEEEEPSADKTGKLLCLLAAKKSWSLPNIYCCLHMPYLQELPTTPQRVGTAAKWAVQSVFFSFLSCYHQVSQCFILCFKLYGQVAHKDLQSQNRTTVLKSFRTMFVLKASVTRITTCGLCN